MRRAFVLKSVLLLAGQGQGLLSMLPLRVLRPCRPLVHRSTRFSRTYNGAANTTPHPTYFQPPPPQPPKSPWRIGIWSSLLLATTSLGAGAYAHSWLYDLPLLGIGLGVLEEGEALPLEAGTMQAAMVEAVRSFLANNVPAMDLERCQEALESGAGYTVTPTALSHSSQLGSNLPCEDHWDSGKLSLIDRTLVYRQSDIFRTYNLSPRRHFRPLRWRWQCQELERMVNI